MSKVHNSFKMIRNFWSGKPIFEAKEQNTVINNDHRKTKTTISNDIKFESEILYDKLMLIKNK